MKKIRLTGFNNVTVDNVEQAFRKNCFTWLFENSDKVFVDGKLISENTKLSYLTSSFNIKPMPKKIETSDTKEGVEIGEKDFVELEIKRVERILLKIENDNNNFILYKKGEIYLEFLRQQSVQNLEDKPQQANNKKDSVSVLKNELADKIKTHFEFYSGNCPRNHQQILKDEDFNKLILWTVFYFENNFVLPEIVEPIKVVNTNKTFVQLSFKYLFKELHREKTYPTSLFDLYKSVFIPYSKDKESNFIAVKNNVEVKKLMFLD